MPIRPTVDFDQSVEDRAAGQTSPQRVFDVRIALAVDFPDVHLEMGISKAEAWQVVKLVAWRLNALVNVGERIAAVGRGRIDIDPKFKRAMKGDAEMGERQGKDHGYCSGFANRCGVAIVGIPGVGSIRKS